MAGNAASRIVGVGVAGGKTILPPIPRVPPPTNKRVVDSVDLAKWYDKHYQEWEKWREQVNVVLQGG